jgi:hypothetical protein
MESWYDSIVCAHGTKLTSTTGCRSAWRTASLRYEGGASRLHASTLNLIPSWSRSGTFRLHHSSRQQFDHNSQHLRFRCAELDGLRHSKRQLSGLCSHLQCYGTHWQHLRLLKFRCNLLRLWRASCVAVHLIRDEGAKKIEGQWPAR